MSETQTETGHTPPPGGPGGDEHHDVTKAMHDRLPIVKVLLMVILTTVSLVVCVAAVVQYFDMSVREEVDRKVLSQPSQGLQTLRHNETIALSRYAWVDEKKGVLRIPVERAAELLLTEWEGRPAGNVEWKDLMATPPAGTAPATPGTPAAPGTPPAAPATPGTPAPAGATPPSAPAPAAGTPAAGGTPQPAGSTTPATPPAAPTTPATGTPPVSPPPPPPPAERPNP